MLKKTRESARPGRNGRPARRHEASAAIVPVGQGPECRREGPRHPLRHNRQSPAAASPSPPPAFAVFESPMLTSSRVSSVKQIANVAPNARFEAEHRPTTRKWRAAWCADRPSRRNRDRANSRKGTVRRRCGRGDGHCNAIVRQHATLVLVVEDDGSAMKYADPFCPVVKHVAGKPASKQVVQTQAYRTKTLVAGDNVMESRGWKERRFDQTGEAHD